MSKSISKNIISKFILNIFNIIIPIIIGPYVLRTLGPYNNGLINYSQAIFGYFFIFASFGVYQYGLREISRVRDDSEKLSKTFSSLFFVTLVTNIVITVMYIIYVCYFHSNTDLYNILIVLTFNLIGNIFYVEWVNEALEEYTFITYKTIITKIIYVILLLTMVKTADDILEYMILLIISTVLNNIISYFYIKRKIKFNFQKLEVRRHIKPMISVVILANVNVLYTQIDKIFLGDYFTTESVAFYTMSQNIVNMINAVLLSIIYVSIPRLSNYISQNLKVGYEKLLDKTTRIYFFVLYPAVIGIIVLAEEIVLLYGGKEYIDSKNILIVFALYILTSGYEIILSNQIMYIFLKEKIQVKIIFIFGILNILLKVFLIKTSLFNGTTAIITTTIANLGVILIQYRYIKRNLKLNFKLFEFKKIKYILFSSIFIPLSMVIKLMVKGLVIRTIITVVICGIVYILILHLTNDEIFKEMSRKIFKNKKVR